MWFVFLGSKLGSNFLRFVIVKRSSLYINLVMRASDRIGLVMRVKYHYVRNGPAMLPVTGVSLLST